MKTIILAIMTTLVLSIGSNAQQLSKNSVNNSVNPGVNPPENIANINIPYYKLLAFTVSSSHVGNQWSTYLTWTAVGETQITGYEIERMMSTNIGLWTSIASVPGSNNNTRITRNYSETFTLVKPVSVFYRLKIHFVNGSVQYSQIVHVTIG